MKSLVLAEKPSVGKELARVLGCKSVTKGYCEGERYVVTWALGHLVELAEPHVYDNKLKEWRLDDLPMLPEKMKLRVMKKTAHQFRTVQGLMKRQDIGDLIIATDAGREGELVARWIMKLGGWNKRPFQRLWISSQTDEAINNGFANLKPGQDYTRLYHSAVCRAEADWLIGLNVTRALTCKFNASLNAGRVQTPTLGIVAAREQEIKHFTPKPYWTITADFGDYTGLWRDVHGNSRIFDGVRAQALAERLNQQTGAIESVTVKPKSDPPPLAYDLTELQREANRRYGFSAKQTLTVLQRLYEQYKVVTYPRTDSRYITTDMVATLPRRLQAVALDTRYRQWAQALLQQPLSPGKRLVNNGKVSDHHAIIPTEQPANPGALSHEERQIYDLVVRRFLAVLSPPCQSDQMTIVTAVAGERFFAQGTVLKDAGWKAIDRPTPDESPDDADDLVDQPLQQQQQGHLKPVKACAANRGQTSPPPRYTEATLLTAMESPGKFIADEELRESIKTGGLGTPATRAEIIEKLIDNYYLERQGKSLIPTGKAFQLLELVPVELKSPELTAQWELRLSQIAQGQDQRQAFMTDIRHSARELVNRIKASTATYTPENLTVNKCPMCGQPLMEVKEKNRRKLVCSDRRCGYEQGHDADGLNFGRKPSKKEQQMNKRLIRQYSDNVSSSTSLGDLLKAALEKNDQS